NLSEVCISIGATDLTLIGSAANSPIGCENTNARPGSSGGLSDCAVDHPIPGQGREGAGNRFSRDGGGDVAGHDDGLAAGFGEEVADSNGEPADLFQRAAAVGDVGLVRDVEDALLGEPAENGSYDRETAD